MRGRHRAREEHVTIGELLGGPGGNVPPIPEEVLDSNELIAKANEVLIAIARPAYVMRMAGDLGDYEKCVQAAKEILVITGHLPAESDDRTTVFVDVNDWNSKEDSVYDE